jgi:hypothetical protein
MITHVLDRLDEKASHYSFIRFCFVAIASRCTTRHETTRGHERCELRRADLSSELQFYTFVIYNEQQVGTDGDGSLN